MPHEWVTEANGKVLVLLGAGASKPQLPTSAELVSGVLDDLDATFNGETDTAHLLWRAISPVLRSMDENIESLYQALQTLTYQDSDPTRFWVKEFMSFDFYEEGEAGLKQLARDADMLLHFVQSGALNALAEASNGAPLEHFESLLRAHKLGIVTLNYDLLVEHAGDAFNVPVATGAEAWDAGFEWSFPDGSVPLLKLHGSFSWRGSKSLRLQENLIPSMGIYEVGGIGEAAPNNMISSTLIFGGGVKLTPFGPFPALMRWFTDRLQEAELLVVVGYSFGDEHINGSLQRWASLDVRRRIIVVDPFPQTDADMYTTFGGLLYGMWNEYKESHGVPGAAASSGVDRLRFIRSGVVEGLPEVFG